MHRVCSLREALWHAFQKEHGIQVRGLSPSAITRRHNHIFVVGTEKDLFGRVLFSPCPEWSAIGDGWSGNLII